MGGALNPNNGQSFTTGRREVNWDGVPDNFSEPNNLPPNFFNVNSPRGMVFNAIETETVRLLISSPSARRPLPARRFASVNINAIYASILQTFGQNGDIPVQSALIPVNLKIKKASFLPNEAFLKGEKRSEAVNVFRQQPKQFLRGLCFDCRHI